MMPSMVSPERSLLVRSVSIAILIASLVSARRIFKAFSQIRRCGESGYVQAFFNGTPA
jgi:hypothetical protein